MPIELHAFDTPNGRKISVALEEMELPYVVRVVDLGKGRQFDPEFLKISPNGKIPAIVDPDGPGGRPVSVFESGAILIYLGEKTGKFYPADLAARIPVLEWLMFQQGGFGPIPGQVHHFVALDDAQDARYALTRFSKETRRLYGVMDQRLAAREFFADAISIADFAILGWAWRHPRHKVDLADFPNVKRWYEAMMARPGVRRGLRGEAVLTRAGRKRRGPHAGGPFRGIAEVATKIARALVSVPRDGADAPSRDLRSATPVPAAPADCRPEPASARTAPRRRRPACAGCRWSESSARPGARGR